MPEGRLLTFCKMHGCANDFIVTHKVTPRMLPRLIAQVPALCDRRRGIGADGVILALPSATADMRMRIFNADGSEAEMCGNGIRCLSAYAREKKLAAGKTLRIETAAGIIVTEYRGALMRVTMGRPVLEARDIPVAGGKGPVIMKKLRANGTTLAVTVVSMGNPHAVIFAGRLTDDLVLGCGRALESHPFFPHKTNVEFIKTISRSEISMRVFERGVGETSACGTGACAGVVAGVLTGRLDSRVTVHLKGGDLVVEWAGRPEDTVFLTGPAEKSFEGYFRFK